MLSEYKENYLEHPIPEAPVAPPGQQVPPAAATAHAHLGAYDMLQELKAMFSKQAEQKLLQTVREFHKNKSHKAAKGGYGKGKSKMGYAPNNVPFSPKPKTPPPPKKDYPAKDTICHQCGKVGHWRRNCPVYLAELMKKKKLSQGASNLGDGHRAAVEAIRTCHLELPSGLVIVLNNFHYAPSITRGVILVSCLFDDGFINRFDENNVILVLKNNLVYFMAIPRDGIFEIDMSCSNTNDSSMYVISNKRAKINLDSSLLWHCRLGHISKKRIKKLQHDRLLNSIDIESLGKTRRAPDRMCLYIDAEEHELGDLGEPANYKAALLDPESKKWLDAMDVEMRSMKDNDVWVLVELTPNARTIGSKWIFKKKTNMDGAAYVFKARLVAKGFTQTYRVDYEETFSSVADIRAIRIDPYICNVYKYPKLFTYLYNIANDKNLNYNILESGF
nr:hypothetical protein [Tanacetum cinerariifolium]